MKKLYRSVIFLLFVAMILTTSAFAWISLATVNRVRDISISAVSNQDLEMSLDGIKYYKTIPKEILLEEIKKLSFTDVTSSDGIIFYNNASKTLAAKKNEEYLSLTFYFRTTSNYNEIHLSDNVLDVNYENPVAIGTFITSKGINFQSGVRFLYGKDDYVEAGEIRKYYARDAMRVSFSNEEENFSKIFDLSFNEDRGYGKEYGALSYYNENKGTNLGVADKVPNTIYKFSEFSKTDPVALTNDSYIMTLVKTDILSDNNKYYKQGKITMNVWLEGHDADAFDAVYKDQLKMQFMFRAVIPKNILEK